MILCVSFSSLFAQESNIFLSRDYWKSNPSIADIDKKMASGHYISALNNNAFDAVSYALIEKVDNSTIKHLLSKEGNGVNKLTHDGRTYIFWAAYKNNLEIMTYLVNQGAKTDIIDSHGYSVLNFAASTGQINTKLYDFLISHGANPTIEKNHSGANALLLVAPFLKDESLIKYFVSNKVDIKSTDNKGNGIFDYAAKGGNKMVLQMLIDKGINSASGNAMVMASQGTRGKKNTLEVYKFLESKGLKVNAIGDNGRNPLHAIAYNSEDLETYKYFIKNGVDINQQDQVGDSPFMNAANSNTLEVVKFLSSYVKDINAKDENGRSALAMAININDVEVAEFLIENDADISTMDTEGNSLAYYLLNTFRTNKPEVFNAKLNLLKEVGLDLSKTQGKGKTLYHIAVEKNNLELLKRINDFKIDVNAKNDDGLTPLHLAAMKANNQDILRYLITIGADKTVKTDFEETVYDLAKENELLLKNDINISFLK
ncbi:ankyrin 1 [Winogradskyella sp. PG-2]|nr:ankyrin 1 [Winogradskyella sp. PG-2]